MVADGVLKEVTHVYAKRRQAPQLGEQLVGTIRVGGRCGSDPICACIAIRVVNFRAKRSCAKNLISAACELKKRLCSRRNPGRLPMAKSYFFSFFGRQDDPFVSLG